MSQISRFHVVLKNWASLKQHWRIMRKDLGLHAFKIKLTQELKPLDHLKRRNFSNWALAKLEENEEFHRKCWQTFCIAFCCIFQIPRKIFRKMKKLSCMNFYTNWVTWSGWSMALNVMINKIDIQKCIQKIEREAQVSWQECIL